MLTNNIYIFRIPNENYVIVKRLNKLNELKWTTLIKHLKSTMFETSKQICLKISKIIA